MVKFEIKGLKELERSLKRLPKEKRKETEKALREEAYRFVLTAQMKCSDPSVREKIGYEITSHEDTISVSIQAPIEAKECLEEAFDEHKNSVSPLIADAVNLALRRI
ncbi:MAG: hypothetical protein JRJ62_13110 [Deltaproteobacteria bacterium]|nr:hypothetical protein [Deltaproteobacteria bacterium]